MELDLNVPALNDVEVHNLSATAGEQEKDDTAERATDGEQGKEDTAHGEEAAHVSTSNTLPSVDAGVDTGQTISSEESGDEDEVQSTPSSQPTVEKPYPGMIFEKWEDAKLHYNRYAKHIGFSIKASISRNSGVDKQKDKCLFVCNKSGKNEDINEQDVPPVRKRIRSITKKTDCKARLRVKRRGQKWHVTMFIEEHTHPCIRKFSLKRYLRSHRGIPKEEREFVKLLHKVNLSAGRVMSIMAELYGGIGNVPYVPKDISNFMATVDAAHTHQDMQLLLGKFDEIKKEDPNFFYRLHVNHDDRVERIFWVDGPARAAYKKYNDCLSFDTTYMTNMYNLPFAPFIGINRYGQSIQMGCAFLKNERMVDFVWLFEAFLETMDGLHQLNIITDQDGAMTTAILVVFPHTCHQNCRWHIMQKAQSVLGNFMSKREELRLEFNEVIDHSMTVDEFETRWAEMILKYNVSDNTHLADLYDLRATFVPAYFKDRFFPFLQTTVQSEGFNAVLKRYVSPHNSLFHFFQQHMKLQEKIDVAEDSNEFEMEDKVLRVWGDYPLEKQALKMYTRPIYLRFRAELRKVTSYNANHVDGQMFDVVPIRGSVFGYGQRGYRVEANTQQEIYSCECSKFSRDGLLCCHVLRVMAQLGAVDLIPQRYILPRWTMPEEELVAKKVELPDVPATRKLTNKERKLIRYGTLCNDWTEVAKVASASNKTKAVAEKYMRALENELKAMKLSKAAKRKEKKQSGDKQGEGLVGEGEQTSCSHHQNVRDPTYTTTKGRPGEKRKQSGIHLKSTKPVKCSLYGSTEHNSASCPCKLTPGKEPMEIDFLRDMV